MSSARASSTFPIRITVITANTGDLIFEHVLSWPHHPHTQTTHQTEESAVPVTTSSAVATTTILAPVTDSVPVSGASEVVQNAFPESKSFSHRTDAVVSMLQVLRQLGREIGIQQPHIRVRFSPKFTTSSASSTATTAASANSNTVPNNYTFTMHRRNRRTHTFNATPMLGLGGVHMMVRSGISSPPTFTGDVAATGTAGPTSPTNSVKAHKPKKKQYQSMIHQQQQQQQQQHELLLIEESYENKLVGGIFFNWEKRMFTEVQIDKLRLELVHYLQDIWNTYGQGILNLPQSPTDRRTPEEIATYEEFRQNSSNALASLLTSHFSFAPALKN